jgi:hypothetical protein
LGIISKIKSNVNGVIQYFEKIITTLVELINNLMIYFDKVVLEREWKGVRGHRKKTIPRSKLWNFDHVLIYTMEK